MSLDLDVTTKDQGIRPVSLPMDLTQEQMKIARKQKMVDALTAQAMQYRGGTEMAGNVAIKRSPWEAVAQALTGGILGYADQNLDAQGAALPQKLNDLNQSEMAKYQSTAGGYQTGQNTSIAPGLSGPVVPMDSPDALTGTTVAANPRKALMDALASKSPIMQAFAQQMLKEQALDTRMRKGKALDAATPDTVIANDASNGTTPLAPKVELQGFKPDEIIVNKNTGKKSDVLNGTVTPITLPNGKPGNLDASGNRRQIGGEGTTVNVSTGEKKGEEMAFELATKKVDALGTVAQKAVESQRNINEMAATDKAGIISGTGADARTSAARFFKTLGAPVDEKLVGNSEAFDGMATRAWQEVIAQSGGNKGITAQEAERLQKMGPQPWMTPEGRQIMYAVKTRQNQEAQDTFRNAVGAHRKTYQTKPEMAGLFDAQLETVFGPRGQNVGIPAPQPAPSTGTPTKPVVAPPAPGVMTFEQLQQMQRGGSH